MLTASFRFLWQTHYTHWRLVKHAGEQRNWKGWFSFLRFLFVNPGFVRRIALPWLAYFRPGFHPWQHDNRKYVERWKIANDGAVTAIGHEAAA
jgi:predicted metal-dependent hydrolase